MTFDPYISYKCQRLASTASESEGAKYRRKTRQIKRFQLDQEIFFKLEKIKYSNLRNGILLTKFF